MKIAPPKWRVMLYCGIALFIACIFLFGEPFVNRRFLSSWLHDGLEGNPGGWKGWKGERDPYTNEIEAAIRKVGPRAIPVLIGKVDAADSTWKRSYEGWQDRTDWLPGWAKVRFRWAEEEHAEAVYGFGLLKNQAVSAIPALSERLSVTNSGPVAAICLVKIGAAALPAVKMALTNSQPGVRRAVLYALELDPSLLQQALKELRQLTADSDEQNAALAFHFLIHHSPTNEALSFLRNALSESRDSIVNLALRRIRHLGTNAPMFIPEISNLLVHPRPGFRRNATNPLKTIDPAVAFAAGINTNPPPPNTNRMQGRRGPRR